MRDLPQGTTLEKHGLGMPSGAPVADAFHHRAVLLRQRLIADFAVHDYQLSIALFLWYRASITTSSVAVSSSHNAV